MSLQSRSRTVQLLQEPWYFGRPEWPFGTWSKYYSLGTGSQVTDSENHPEWVLIKRSGGYDGDIGGAFQTQRHYHRASDLELDLVANGKAFRGKRYAASDSFDHRNFNNVVPSSLVELEIAGTTAIARCIPTAPVAGVSNFIGELYRDGVPKLIGASLIKTRLKTFRNYGSEYLNVEFGWAPFVRDLFKLVRTTQESKKILTQYMRNSGRPVRRSYHFPTETTESDSGLFGTQTRPVLDGDMYRGSVWCECTIHTTTFHERWFKGSFTYHVPKGNNPLDKMIRSADEAEKLYGFKLTPEVLWNLAPWSWAADWFGNFGDVMTNLSAFTSDGLVMNYGYLMDHKVSESTWKTAEEVWAGSFVNYTWVPDRRTPSLTQTFGTEVKTRIRATPFGFGLNDASFSARQLAIIAALGISHNGAHVSR